MFFYLGVGPCVFFQRDTRQEEADEKKKKFYQGVFQLLEPITSTDWVASFKLLHQ